MDTPLLSDRSECATKILNPPSWLFVCSALLLGDARPCVLKLQLKKRSSYYRRPRQNLSSRFLVISEHGIHTFVQILSFMIYSEEFYSLEHF